MSSKIHLSAILPENTGYTALIVEIPHEFDINTLPKMPKYVGTFKAGRMFRIDMTPSLTTGERNEAGARRIAKLLEALDGDYVEKTMYTNSSTIAEFCEYHNI